MVIKVVFFFSRVGGVIVNYYIVYLMIKFS